MELTSISNIIYCGPFRMFGVQTQRALFKCTLIYYVYTYIWHTHLSTLKYFWAEP